MTAMKAPTKAVRAAVAAIVVCLTVLGGCADPADRSDMTPQEQFDTLMQRPDIDEITKRYERLQKTIRAELSDNFDLADWTEDEESAMKSACGDFPDVDSWDKVSAVLPLWSTKDAIGKDQWSEAKAILRKIGGEYGFNRVSLDFAKAETRTYELMEGTGAKLRIMVNSYGYTVLRVSTGCHLRTLAKERGRPITDADKDEIRSSKAAEPS